MVYLRLKAVINDSPYMENVVFKFCYQWTVFVLVAFSFVVTCRLFIGYSFICKLDNGMVPQRHLDIKCYNDDLYIFPVGLVTRNETYPVIEPEAKEYKRQQSYYRWVNLLFLVQAFILYIPYVLWKYHENGYIRRLISGLQRSAGKEGERDLELDYLAKYVLRTKGKHNLYMALCVLIEALNFSIVVSHVVQLDNFFNVTGVPEFLPLTIETWSDFQKYYFPSEAMCTFKIKGVSGLDIMFTVMCMLPLNDLYLQMFRFLHTWYIVLAVLCGLVLLYRFALFLPFIRVIQVKCTVSLAEASELNFVCNRMSFTDWFFLTRLQKAMLDVDFADMLKKTLIISQAEIAHNEEDKMTFNTLALIGEPMREIDAISGVISPL